MLLFLCFLGCPLMMGVMLLMKRERHGAELERDISRLNAEAARLRASTTVAAEAVEHRDVAGRLPRDGAACGLVARSAHFLRFASWTPGPF